MSDMQDLIHHLTVKAFNQGVIHERQRIIEIITKHPEGWQKSHGLNYRAELRKIIASILGDE